MGDAEPSAPVSSTASLRKRAASKPKGIPEASADPVTAGRGLLTFDQLPAWQQDNAYILTGYRLASGSIPTSLLSIFSCAHNETVNIHTHLWPGVVFLILPFFHSVPSLFHFLPFYVGAAACLLISALFHATSNVSLPVARAGNQLDYLGILALITGSFLPSVRFGFSCRPDLQWLYWGMIAGLALACGVVTVDRRFRTPAWRTGRAAMYVALGLSAAGPVVHGLGLYGWRGLEARIALRWTLAQGALYIFGAGLYAARIPEKWSPGRYDILGSSHQIFHVFVVVAAFVHWIGLLKAAAFAYGTRCDDAL